MTKLDMFLVGFSKAFTIVDYELLGKVFGYSIIGIALLITIIEHFIFENRTK